MGAEVGDKVVLVNPSEVVEIMKKVPKGKLITIVEICRKLARKHRARACCSLTTGIFIMIAANAAEEAAKQGKDLGIPYWRTLKANGFLNEKYPGGAEAQKELLEKEGFKITRKGKKYAVQNYQDFLLTHAPNIERGVEALRNRADRGAFGWRQDDVFMEYLG
jgi:alkylated DNA nucleotide flippase Atl1